MDGEQVAGPDQTHSADGGASQRVENSPPGAGVAGGVEAEEKEGGRSGVWGWDDGGRARRNNGRQRFAVRQPFFFPALQVDRLSAARKNAAKAWKPTARKPPGLGKTQTQHERIGSVGVGLGGGRGASRRWAREMGWLQAFDSLDSLDSLEAHRKASAAPRSSRSGIVAQARQRRPCRDVRLRSAPQPCSGRFLDWDGMCG